MDLVIDANVLFAILIRSGVTSLLFFRRTFHFYAPEFIFEEFELYKDQVKSKTDRTEEEFQELLHIVQRRITVVPKEEIDPYIEKAKQISPDIKDVTYVALALKLNCAIWSYDKNLKEKQNVVTVYSTSDLLQL